MSRKRRPQFGLDIVCRDHPTELLFSVRADPITGEIWYPFRPDAPAPIWSANFNRNPRDFKFSRRCGEGGCSVLPQFHNDRVKAVLREMHAAGMHQVVTVRDSELEKLVRRVARGK